MLDLKNIRENPEAVALALARRNGEYPIAELIETDARHRQTLILKEELNRRLNEIAAQFKKGGLTVEVRDTLRSESQQTKARRETVDAERQVLDNRVQELLLALPNLPDLAVPDGRDEHDNVVVKAWGELPVIANAKHHYEIGPALNVFDFERGTKLAGPRFTVLPKVGAKLERALMNFMLDLHGNRGYDEVFPPILVNRESMMGTGQLPKFDGDFYRCADDELFLIPTAEVPVTNLYRGEVIEERDLPILHCAYTPCFRREAGAAGRDTRGYIRQHQFNKVELVKFCLPEAAEEAHEQLTRDAEAVLEALQLPYRRVLLCAGDMGFGGKKCYDLEVWFPAQNKYREISSCTNFGDFQARRANIRYRPADGGKPRYLNTLNGSGLAIGRTLAAILENYQKPDGTVVVPEVLVDKLSGLKLLEPKGTTHR